MSRIPTPASIDAAPTASRPLLEGVKKQLGVVPNMFRLISNSPAALEGYLSLSAALKGGVCQPQRASVLRWRWPKRTGAATACQPIRI